MDYRKIQVQIREDYIPKDKILVSQALLGSYYNVRFPEPSMTLIYEYKGQEKGVFVNVQNPGLQ